MKYVIKFKDYLDLDNDAIIIDFDTMNVLGDSLIMFIADEVPVLYVPVNSIMFIKKVNEHERLFSNPDGLLN